MFACLFVAAALFLGLDFLQFRQLSGTAGLGRVQWHGRGFGLCLSFRFGRCGHLSIFSRRGIIWRGFGLFHTFLQRANAGGAFLRRQVVLSGFDRFDRGGLRRRGNGFDLWRSGPMRCGRRALAAHLDLDSAAPGTTSTGTQRPRLDSAKGQLATTGQAELFGFSAIVAHLRTLS